MGRAERAIGQQEGLSRSNGLEDTQGGLKSLVEVQVPDEGT